MNARRRRRPRAGSGVALQEIRGSAKVNASARLPRGDHGRLTPSLTLFKFGNVYTCMPPRWAHTRVTFVITWYWCGAVGGCAFDIIYVTTSLQEQKKTMATEADRQLWALVHQIEALAPELDPKSIRMAADRISFLGRSTRFTAAGEAGDTSGPKRQKGGSLTDGALPDAGHYALQKRLVSPASFIRSLLRRRETLSLPSTVAAEKQPAETDVWGLCQEYEEEMFDSMDDDINRNAAYARAFAAVPSTQLRWLEIGCGAAATLTRIALANGPQNIHVTAFEVNADCAAAAAAEVRRSHGDCVNVVVGPSTDTSLLAPPSARFDVLLHEIFGVFASSEGCVQMLAHGSEHYLAPRRAPPRSVPVRPRVRDVHLHGLRHAYALAKSRGLRRARRALPPAARCIPSRSGTFYSPCELRSEDLDACEDILLDSLRAPNVLQVPRAPIGEMSLARSSAVLDMQDFGGSARTKRETGATEEVQTREHLFTIARDGVLNCLAVFIWVDLGIGPAAEISADEMSPGPADGFAHRFPFGADSGAGAAAVAAAESGVRLNDFTSLCTPDTVRERTHATNWFNPLLLLPQPTAVRSGDRLRVLSRSAADSIRPSYAFELKHIPRNGDAGSDGVPLGVINVEFNDIYPYYG